MAISAYTAYVHSQIASQIAPGCDVSETISCSVVLASKYAYLPGKIPVAWLALVAYALYSAGGILAASGSGTAPQRRRLAGMLFAASIVGAVYSVYLAFIAVFVLRAVCLLCTGLYLVNAGLLVATALLLNAVRVETSRGREGDSGLVRWVGVGALAGLAVVLGLLGWEALSDQRVVDDPDFERWYGARPLVERPPAGGYAKGKPDAPVVIAEFSDFECGHCAQVYRTLKAVLPRYRDDVRVVFHHYPLDSACNPAVSSSFHRNACLAAIASECASQQGEFWSYHDLLFDNQNDLSRANLERFAADVGLDLDEFSKCLASEEARSAVVRDIEEGKRLAIKSTPTMFFNRRTIVGALEADKVEQAIRIERALSVRKN